MKVNPLNIPTGSYKVDSMSQAAEERERRQKDSQPKKTAKSQPESDQFEDQQKTDFPDESQRQILDSSKTIELMERSKREKHKPNQKFLSSIPAKTLTTDSPSKKNSQ